MSKGKLLIIEDDKTIQDVVRDYLTAAGYKVACASDGLEGFQVFHAFQPELIILDINLPSMSGLEITTQVRRSSDVYIIMLTARGEESDQIKGLQLGADDYVTKPFSPRTLVARVDAVLRRRREARLKQTQFLFEHITISVDAREVRAASQTLELTFTEFNLLVEFARHAGQVLNRQQLLDRVWSADYAGNDRVVDVYVGQVRRKLEDATGKLLITTMRGAGYKFIDQKL
ncbi:MAG: response regulator transcription factor [Candidatus Promineifilaceae bacterium]